MSPVQVLCDRMKETFIKIVDTIQQSTAFRVAVFIYLLFNLGEDY